MTGEENESAKRGGGTGRKKGREPFLSPILLFFLRLAPFPPSPPAGYLRLNNNIEPRLKPVSVFLLLKLNELRAKACKEVFVLAHV